MQLPKANINLSNIDEEEMNPSTMTLEALSLLTIPARSIIEANMKLHRPLYQQLPPGFTDLRLGQDDETKDELKSRPRSRQSHILGSQLQSREVSQQSGLLPDDLRAISALSLGDSSLGDFLIATDDDDEINLHHGGLSERVFTAFEARKQYQKKAAQMDLINTLASTTVDWL
jgi:hypothetical protein